MIVIVFFIQACSGAIQGQDQLRADAVSGIVATDATEWVWNFESGIDCTAISESTLYLVKDSDCSSTNTIDVDVFCEEGSDVDYGYIYVNQDLDEATVYTFCANGLTDENGDAYIGKQIFAVAGDSDAPSISSQSPASGASDVSVGTSIQLTFNEPIDADTVNDSSVVLIPDVSSSESFGYMDMEQLLSQSVSASISMSSDAKTIMLETASDLDSATRYIVSASASISDISGNTMSQGESWYFTTLDNTVPAVSSTSPSDSSVGVSVSSTVQAIFSKSMDESSITSSSFSVSGGVTGSFSYNSSTKTAIFTPDADLSSSTSYTVTLNTDITDSNGIALASNYQWTFETASGVASPSISSTNPDSDENSILVNTTITAVLSENYDCTTVDVSSFTVELDGGGSVSGSIACANANAVFTPDSNLTESSDYNVTLTTDIESDAGGALASDYMWSFSTAAQPSVSVISPSDGAGLVSVYSDIDITFDSQMDVATLIADNIKLLDGMVEIDITFSYDAGSRTLTITPDDPLTSTTEFTVSLTDLDDSDGNPMTDMTSTFTTDVAPDTFLAYFGATTNAAFNDIATTGAGQYLAVGITDESGAGNKDYFVSRFDSDGSIDFQKVYGSAGDDRATSIAVTSDGGFIMAGETNGFIPALTASRNLWVVKVDASDVISWEKVYGTASADGGNGNISILELSSGNYLLTGYSLSSAWNTWMMVLNSSGIEQSHFAVGKGEIPKKVIEANNGDYIVVGYSVIGMSEYDMWAMRVTSAGVVEWEYTYAVSGQIQPDNSLNSVVELADGSIVVVGKAYDSNTTDSSMIVMKLGSNGQETWVKSYGSNNDRNYDVVSAADGGLVIAGSQDVVSNMTAYLIKLTTDGAISWGKQYSLGTGDVFYGVSLSADDGYMAVGETTSNIGDKGLLMALTGEIGDIGNACGSISIYSPTENAMTITRQVESDGSDIGSTPVESANAESSSVTVFSPTLECN